MLFFLYLLVLTAYIFTHGFYSPGGIVLIFLSFGVYFFHISNRIRLKTDAIDSKSLFILLCLLSVLLYGGLYQNNPVLVYLSYLLLGLNLLFAVKLSADQSTAGSKKIFIYMVLIAVLLRLFMVWSSPTPYIDVYDYLKIGALGFIKGQNPYAMTYTKLYPNFTPDYYAYPPGMLYLTLPFVGLFRDPRYTMIFAEMGAAFLIYDFLKKSKEGYIVPLLFLLNPISLYMIEQSYTETLIFFLIVFSVWLWRKKKFYLFALLLGLTLSTKQYLFLLIPLYWKLINGLKEKIYIIGGALLTSFLLILPFLIWNYPEFMKDVVYLQGTFPPRYEGLSFFAFVFRLGGSYNQMLSLFITVISLIYIYTRKHSGQAGFFILSSLLFLVVFFFNKWSFINYYYLISQLLLAGIVMKSVPQS